jgi:hypothetical protein
MVRWSSEEERQPSEVYGAISVDFPGRTFTPGCEATSSLEHRLAACIVAYTSSSCVHPSEMDLGAELDSSCMRWSPSIDVSELSGITYIGKGNFAYVYRAQLRGQDDASRTVTLKVLKPSNQCRPTVRRNFLQEVAIHKLMLKHK